MSNRKWNKWTEKEIAKLIKYWESGLKVKEIQKVFSKSRTESSVVMKIHVLQKAGKIKNRNVIKSKTNGGKSKLPPLDRRGVIAKQGAEIKILKGLVESAKKSLQELNKNAEDNQTLIKHLRWKNQQYWDELFALKHKKKYKHSVWNEPYKTPEWVKAGKKAMMGMPQPSQPQANMSSLIRAKCFDVGKLLEEKNAQYGDSALNPIRVFSKADATEQLKVRIDDKLSRLVRGDDSIESDEDVIKDLIGYLVLLLIQYDTQAQAGENA